MADQEKEHPATIPDLEQAGKAAENFISRTETVVGVEEYGRGIIHDTYLVRSDDPANNFILQRINTGVFPRPEMIMHNMRILSDHVGNWQKHVSDRFAPDWKMVRIIRTSEGQDLYIDPAGGCWRALDFIRDASPLEEIISLKNVREAGRALGLFHHFTDNIDPGSLHDTLPGFHNIGSYLSRYDRVLSAGRQTGPAGEKKYCRDFIAARRSWAPVLENGRKNGRLRVRVIHGDPKINNIMVDVKTGRAVSIIDLDTVKPGLLLYDLGDCLRSCCNVSGENADPAAVRFDPERCAAVLGGYTSAARDCLTDGDIAFLYDAIRLIPFELGLRFYTDYLEGSPYFRIRYATQNLDRAIVQFKLVESIEAQEEGIRAVIEKLYLV